MKRPDAGANLLIGSSNAFARTQIVEPGLHDEGLVEVFRVNRVSVDAPANGSIAEADATQLMNGMGEIRIVCSGNAVFDGDAHGTVGWFGVESQLWCGALPLMRRMVRNGTLQYVE